MSGKRQNSKYKIARRVGGNLWGSPKSPTNTRPGAPGQHGQRRGKKSDFGLQLMAKQTLKGYYGNIGEKQFRRYYKEAVRRRGNTSDHLIELLERRLDATLFHIKLAPTVFAARQLINHGHVTVNGQRVNVPSFSLNDGDEIQIKEKSRNIPAVVQAVEAPHRDVPEYLNADHGNFKGTFVRAPEMSEVPYGVEMQPNLVIEFYSR